MIAMSATSPPASSTKRRRICGEFSLSSAPPIGMIHPRSPPSATLLAHMLLKCPRLQRARFCHREARESEKSCAPAQARADRWNNEYNHGGSASPSRSHLMKSPYVPLLLPLLALLTLAAARAEEPGFAEGTKLLSKYNCQQCHSADRPGVGPSLRAVAKRYASDPNAP